MSTYIEILRAHQRGKLKANEPSRQDPTTALPESDTADTPQDELLQEETSGQTSPDAAPETDGASAPDPDATDDVSASSLLQEETGDAALSAEQTAAPVAEEPEEPLDLIGRSLASSQGILQEETGASPLSDTDDASEAAGTLPEEAGQSLRDAGGSDEGTPEGMLQEEAAASPLSDADDTPPAGTLPEEAANRSPQDADDSDDVPPGMLQEEIAVPAIPEQEAHLPEEHDPACSDDHDADATSLDSLLAEEVSHPPPNFDDMDDAALAQMLQDEPEAPSKHARQPAGGDDGAVMLADEIAPESEAETTGEVAADSGIHTWLSGCVMLMVRIYEDAARNEVTDLSPLLRHLDRFSVKIYADPEELNALELDIANRIESIRQAHANCGDLVQKAVMMMLYAYKICVQLHMEPVEMNRYVAAAILHNIGMAQIFVDTRLKEGALTNAERTLIRKVPDVSREYLKRCGISDRVILLAAEQSHERYDGSGPHGLTGVDIAQSARIVGLLSMFEALVHIRAYRKRLLPLDAIRELVNGQKNRFDPVMLKALIESISLYPVGTYVQLNSGDIGQVIRVQPRLPLRPQIVLTSDGHGNRIQPREVDLHKQPNLMIRRCMYKEALTPTKQEEEAEAQA